jgi:predicted dehydrogenase
MSSTHDRLRAGFLGAGRWSTDWAGAVLPSGRFGPTGVVEPNAAMAETFGKRFGIPRVAGVEALAARGTNLWLVGTPTASHLRDVRATAAATTGPVIIVVASPVALDPGQVSEMERLEDGRVRIVLSAHYRWYFDNLTDPGTVSAAVYWGHEARLQIDVHGTAGSGTLTGEESGGVFVVRPEVVIGAGDPEGAREPGTLTWPARSASRQLLIRDAGDFLTERLARGPARNRLPTLGQARQGLALVVDMYRAASTTPPGLLRVGTRLWPAAVLRCAHTGVTGTAPRSCPPAG